jgi:hypothetical protein
MCHIRNHEYIGSLINSLRTLFEDSSECRNWEHGNGKVSNMDLMKNCSLALILFDIKSEPNNETFERKNRKI